MKKLILLIALLISTSVFSYGGGGTEYRIDNIVQSVLTDITISPTNNLIVDGGTETNYVLLNPSTAPAWAEGLCYYDNGFKALTCYNEESEVSQQLGQEFFVRGTNTTGSTILNGQAIYVSGWSSDLPEFSLASANVDLGGEVVIGIATHDIEAATIGYATRAGFVRNVDTSSWSTSDTLWLSDTPGALTTTRPVSPSYSIRIGDVGEVNASTGTINVAIDIGGNTADAAKFFNGAILESHTITTSSDGSTVILSLERDGGGDLALFFNSIFYVFDTSPAATIALTAGSDTSPTLNYVYIPESTKVLTVSTSGFPSSQHVPIATLVVQSALSVQTDGVMKEHAWTDHLAGSDDQGHLAHLNKWIRNQHATWVSGTVQSFTGDGTATINMSSTSGVVLQLHDHSFPAFSSPAEFYVVNDPVTPFKKITNIADIQVDSDGDSLLNRTYGLVIWGAVAQNDTNAKYFINLPNDSRSRGFPSLVRENLQDQDFSIPLEYKGVGFLVTRLVIDANATGTIWRLYLGGDGDDLRGKVPSSSVGGLGGGGTVTAFDDSAFNIFNTADNTKIMTFDASGITTATTRLFSVPDFNGVLLVENSDTANIIVQGNIESATVNSKIKNSHAEIDLAGWATYSNTVAADKPESGTGGTASIVLSRNPTTPLHGLADFLITKNATDEQGDGVSYAFTIDNGDTLKSHKVSIDFKDSANYADGDIRAYVYDTTNNKLIEPGNTEIYAGTGSHTFEFPATTSTSYRLIFHIASTSALAYTFNIDSVNINRVVKQSITPITNWQSYTPTVSPITGFASTPAGKWRRVGDSMEVMIYFAKDANVGVGAGDLTVTLPSGNIPDTAKLTNVNNTNLGTVTIYRSGSTYVVMTAQSNGTSIRVTEAGALTRMIGTDVLGSWEFAYKMTIPIAGWSSNISIGEIDAGRKVFAHYTGTTQSMINGTTRVNFDTMVEDSHGAVITGTSWAFTVPYAGVYQTIAFNRLTASSIWAAGEQAHYIISSKYVMTNTAESSTTMPISLHGITEKYYEKGDTISVNIEQYSGGAINTEASGIFNSIMISSRDGTSAISASEKVSVRYTSNSGAGYGSGAQVNFEDKDYDDYVLVTTGAAWKATIQTSGKYEVSSRVLFGSATWVTGDFVYLQLYKSGVQYAEIGRLYIQNGLTGNIGIPTVTTTLDLVKGDYIDLRIGGSVSGGLAAKTLEASGIHNYITIEKQ